MSTKLWVRPSLGRICIILVGSAEIADNNDRPSEVLKAPSLQWLFRNVDPRIESSAEKEDFGAIVSQSSLGLSCKAEAALVCPELCLNLLVHSPMLIMAISSGKTHLIIRFCRSLSSHKASSIVRPAKVSEKIYVFHLISTIYSAGSRPFTATFSSQNKLRSFDSPSQNFE